MSQRGYVEKELTCAGALQCRSHGVHVSLSVKLPLMALVRFSYSAKRMQENFPSFASCPSEEQVIESSAYKHRSVGGLVNLAATRNLFHCRRWLHVKKHFAVLTHVIFQCFIKWVPSIVQISDNLPNLFFFCPWSSLLNKMNENLTLNIILVPPSRCGGLELADFLTTCQHLKQMVDCPVLNRQAEAVKNNWTANWKNNHL